MRTTSKNFLKKLKNEDNLKKNIDIIKNDTKKTKMKQPELAVT